MQFFLTSYIYPIEKLIVLSNTLNISLDNPRTKEEIHLVEKNIKTSLDSPDETYEYGYHSRIPITHERTDILTLESGVENFYEHHTHDEYVTRFRKENSDESVIRQLAAMWVIARYDDDGEVESMKEFASSTEDGTRGFFLLDDENPIVKNSDNLVGYSHLLSLLIQNSDSYYGESFIFHSNYWRINEPEIDKYINGVIMAFCFYSDRPTCDDDMSWKIAFPCIKEELITKSLLIEKNLDDKSSEVLLYISNLLKISSSEIKDEKYKLVTYVGILELLLTHNPNFMRFNVEDSINKQFQLKVATLVYLNTDRKTPITLIQKRLKIIYQQRSNIAHGNFKELNKYIKSLSKKEDQEEFFEDLVSDTISYIRIVIEEYLRDKDFIRFLKDS